MSVQAHFAKSRHGVLMAFMTNCPLCGSFAAPNVKGVVRHIGLVHAHEAGFRLVSE